MVRLLKRYPLSGGYLILVLFVVFLILFDILGSYNRELRWKKDAEYYRYPFEYQMTAFSLPVEEREAFAERLHEVEGVNVKIDEIEVSVTGEAGRIGFADALLSSGIGERYPMKEGTLPAADADPPQAAVGTDYEGDLYERDGASYLQIDGTEYEISGIIESPYSDYMNKKIVVCYEDLRETRKEKAGENLSMLVQSDAAPDDALNQMYRILKEVNPNVIIQAYRETASLSEPTGTDSEERTMQWMLIGFCALVLALVADFWVEDRKKEMAVRKTFGFGTVRILWMMLLELLEFMGAAFALYLIVWGIRLAAGMQTQLFLLQADMYNIWVILGVLLLLFLAGVLLPTLRTLRCHPADVLKRE